VTAIGGLGVKDCARSTAAWMAHQELAGVLYKHYFFERYHCRNNTLSEHLNIIL
jgi:hypothetical protein